MGNSGLPLSLKRPSGSGGRIFSSPGFRNDDSIRDRGHAVTDDDKTAGYAALRHQLSEVLKEQRSQDRLAKALLAPDPARSREVVELTRSIADILVTACPNADANTDAAALADAAALVGDALSSATQSADTRLQRGRARGNR